MIYIQSTTLTVLAVVVVIFSSLCFSSCNGTATDDTAAKTSIATSVLPTAYGLFGMSDNRFKMRIKQMTFQFVYKSVGEDDTGHVMMRPDHLEIVHREDGRLNEPVKPEQILNCTVSIEPMSKYFAGSECPFHKVQRFDSGTKLSVEIDSMLEPLTKFYVFEESSTIYYVRVSTRRTLSGRAMVDIWTFDQNDVNYDIRQFSKVRCTESLERYYNYNKAERGKTIMRQIEAGIDVSQVSTIALEKTYDIGLNVKFPKPLARNKVPTIVRRRYNHTSNTFTFDKLPKSTEIQSMLDDIFNYRAKATLSKEDLDKMKSTTTTTTTTTTIKPDFETVESIFGVKPTTSFESVESIMGSKPTTSFESVESIFNSKPTDSIESVESIMKREEPTKPTPTTTKPKYDSKVEVEKIERIFGKKIDDVDIKSVEEIMRTQPEQQPNLKKELKKIKRIFGIDMKKKKIINDDDDDNTEGSGDGEFKIRDDNDNTAAGAVAATSKAVHNNMVTSTHTQNFITYIIILFILLAVITLATICHLFSVCRLLKYKRKTSYEDTIMLGSERIDIADSNRFCKNAFEMSSLHRKQNDPLPNVPQPSSPNNVTSSQQLQQPNYYNSSSLPCSHQNIYDSIVKPNNNYMMMMLRNNINNSYVRMDKVINRDVLPAATTYMDMNKKCTIYKSLPSILVKGSTTTMTNNTNNVYVNKETDNLLFIDDNGGYEVPTSIYKIPKPPRPIGNNNYYNNSGADFNNGSTTNLLGTTPTTATT